jgi:hypothetical protein
MAFSILGEQGPEVLPVVTGGKGIPVPEGEGVDGADHAVGLRGGKGAEAEHLQLTLDVEVKQKEEKGGEVLQNVIFSREMVGASEEHLADLFTRKSLLTILASGLVVEGAENRKNSCETLKFPTLLRKYLLRWRKISPRACLLTDFVMGKIALF